MQWPCQTSDREVIYRQSLDLGGGRGRKRCGGDPSWNTDLISDESLCGSELARDGVGSAISMSTDRLLSRASSLPQVQVKKRNTAATMASGAFSWTRCPAFGTGWNCAPGISLCKARPRSMGIHWSSSPRESASGSARRDTGPSVPYAGREGRAVDKHQRRAFAVDGVADGGPVEVVCVIQWPVGHDRCSTENGSGDRAQAKAIQQGRHPRHRKLPCHKGNGYSP